MKTKRKMRTGMRMRTNVDGLSHVLGVEELGNAEVLLGQVQG